MKRVIAWVLLLAMILGLVSMAVLAADAKSNTMVQSGFCSDEKEELPDQYFWGQRSVKRKDVCAITFQDTKSGAPQWVWDLSAARDKSVIGWYRNGNLVVAADGKIALNENSALLFAGMIYCKEINFNDAVDTSNVKNMSCMFRDCSQLRTLDLGCFDTSNVTDMSFMFYGCKMMTALDVSSFNTEKVASMWGMFTACRRVEKLDLSSFRTPELTNMKAMFDSCAAMKEIDLSGFDTSKVTNLQNLFGGCRSLEAVDLNNFKTDNVVYMSNLFANCTGLKKVDMKNFTSSAARGMSQMFLNVGELTLDCGDEAICNAYARRNYC